jgi:hypothetical protein
MTAGPKHNAKKEKKKTSKKIEITSSQLNGDDDEPTATRIKTKYPPTEKQKINLKEKRNCGRLLLHIKEM